MSLYGEGEPRRTCPFPDPNLSGDGVRRAPRVKFIEELQFELPCDSLVEGEGVRVDFPTSFVSPRGCLEQRREGLCPRGFGLTVPENLRQV